MDPPPFWHRDPPASLQRSPGHPKALVPNGMSKLVHCHNESYGYNSFRTIPEHVAPNLVASDPRVNRGEIGSHAGESVHG